LEQTQGIKLTFKRPMCKWRL